METAPLLISGMRRLAGHPAIDLQRIRVHPCDNEVTVTQFMTSEPISSWDEMSDFGLDLEYWLRVEFLKNEVSAHPLKRDGREVNCVYLNGIKGGTFSPLVSRYRCSATSDSLDPDLSFWRPVNVQILILQFWNRVLTLLSKSVLCRNSSCRRKFFPTWIFNQRLSTNSDSRTFLLKARQPSS